MDADIKLREISRGTTTPRKYQEGSSFDLTFSDVSYTVGKGKKFCLKDYLTCWQIIEKWLSKPIVEPQIS